MTEETARSPIRNADLDDAVGLLMHAYRREKEHPGSPVTAELVQLNIDHCARVRANARAVARGERLDGDLLELAATLHDVAKLDHRRKESGGIDTWHHHERGAAIVHALVREDLDMDFATAEAVATIVETHSDIPFIRRYWESNCAGTLPAARSALQRALRDADAIDLIWVGGMAKIVPFRQIPGSAFYREDGGDIRKAIASAHRSFEERQQGGWSHFDRRRGQGGDLRTAFRHRTARALHPGVRARKGGMGKGSALAGGA